MRKLTEEEKAERFDRAFPYIVNFITIFAVNVIATWISVAIITIIFGAKSMTPEGRTEVKLSLDLHYLFSYIFMLILTVLVILFRRQRFTYGDPVAEWNNEKKGLFLRNALCYLICNIPVSLYFIIVGFAKIYGKGDTTAAAVGIAKANTAEALWVANLFAPQATFYRLTRNLVLGILINFVVYYGLTAYYFIIKPMKPPKKNEKEPETGTN